MGDRERRGQRPMSGAFFRPCNISPADFSRVLYVRSSGREGIFCYGVVRQVDVGRREGGIDRLRIEYFFSPYKAFM